MKILVDSTLALQESWFDLLPINITLDGETYQDTNKDKDLERIKQAKEIKTSYLSPEAVKELKGKQTIIFTIPASLSGQNSVYQSLKDQNTLVIEGTALFTKKEEVKKIIQSNSDLKEIEKQINSLNKQVEYDGLLVDFKSVPPKGRISNVIVKILSKVNAKAWLVFKNGVWKRKKIFKNVTKALKEISSYKDKLTLISSSIEVFNLYKDKVDVPIIFQRMTNAMVAHSGSGFIAIF